MTLLKKSGVLKCTSSRPPVANDAMMAVMDLQNIRDISRVH